MARNILFDFDPIKDGSWNIAPFHGDYMIKPRKSSPVDPYELMPRYPGNTGDPEAAPPKPNSRALTGLDGFWPGRLDIADLSSKISQHGLTQPIAEEFNISDTPKGRYHIGLERHQV